VRYYVGAGLQRREKGMFVLAWGNALNELARQVKLVEKVVKLLKQVVTQQVTQQSYLAWGNALNELASLRTPRAVLFESLVVQKKIKDIPVARVMADCALRER
jgi:hypothetical protein